jgi:hypothetical protein
MTLPTVSQIYQAWYPFRIVIQSSREYILVYTKEYSRVTRYACIPYFCAPSSITGFKVAVKALHSIEKKDVMIRVGCLLMNIQDN